MSKLKTHRGQNTRLIDIGKIHSDKSIILMEIYINKKGFKIDKIRIIPSGYIEHNKRLYIKRVPPIVVFKVSDQKISIHKTNTKVVGPRVRGLVKCEKIRAIMAEHEEYDPERPFLGRPNDKIPFKGYFDPAQQSYTIENFDAEQFQVNDKIDPTMVINEPISTQSPSTVPDHVKRLAKIPFSGIAANRDAEIKAYLEANHNITYAQLQDPNGLPGQVKWKTPEIRMPVGSDKPSFTCNNLNDPRSRHRGQSRDPRKQKAVYTLQESIAHLPGVLLTKVSKADKEGTGSTSEQTGHNLRVEILRQPANAAEIPKAGSTGKAAIIKAFNVDPSKTASTILQWKG